MLRHLATWSICLVAMLVLAAVASDANECVPELPYASSSISVQVWDRLCGTVPRAEVTVVDGRGKAVKFGLTDDTGYLSLSGVAPGEYQVVVATNGFPSFQRRVSLRRLSEFPGRTLLIALGLANDCHHSCTGPERGARKVGPGCLFGRGCPTSG